MISKTFQSILQTNFSLKNIYHHSRFRKVTYTTAITRGVPNTFHKALTTTTNNTNPISLLKAKEQHQQYIQSLLNLNSSSSSSSSSSPIKIHEIPPNDTFPDCVFIEDTAIVIDQKAVITRMGADSRKGEVDAVKKVLLELGLEVYDMRDDTPSSTTCDGGDVLFPVSYNTTTNQKNGGDHLFVGISNRTNYAGAEYLQSIFSDVEVIPVNLQVFSSSKGEAPLHLKSIITHIDDKTLLLPDGCMYNTIRKQMALEELGYDVIRLPDVNACNVVSVNGTVMAQSSVSETSRDILTKEVSKRGLDLVWVDTSEFAKCDGALTCKSILIP